METLVSLAVSSFTMFAIYQLMVPKFSNGGVAFQEVDFWKKLAFGLSMSLCLSLIQLIVAFVAVVTVVPVMAVLTASTTPSPALIPAIMVAAIVALIAVLQASHWLGTLLLGKLMPGIIRVDSSRAAFKGAWAPTLVFSFIYGLMLLVVGSLFFGMVALNVH